MSKAERSPTGFFNLSVAAHPQSGRAALLAVSSMTPTGNASNLCETAPEKLQEVSGRVKHGVWDVDLQRALFSALPVDLGRFSCSGDAPVDRENLAQRVAEIMDAGGRPLIIGGDDSVAIPPLQGLKTRGGVHVVQIDAHLDWKNRLGDEMWGRSSVMRRASEMPWISGITQIGLRGCGTAMPEDASAASCCGTLITSRMMKKMNTNQMLEHITDENVYLTLDLDGINPAEMPAVPSPSPGGPGVDEVTDIIISLAKKHRLLGANLTECAPRNDVGLTGMQTALRLLTVLADVLSVD